LNTADTLTFNCGNLDVSLIAPESGPGVSNNVVLFTTLSSITDSSNGMVENGSTFDGVEDTTFILLEDFLVSLNCDRDDTLIDGSLELRNTVWNDGFVSSNVHLDH